MISIPLESDVLIWVGIAFCLSQAALFSGLNLAIFGISRLRLEVRTASGDADAARVLALRKQFNFTLATVLWSNVALNVCLTLLSRSVLAGVSAFLFSTVVITAFGEIAPQAYFSRHALRMASKLEPFLRVYQVLVYPVAKPTAVLLDAWLGHEAIPLFRESDFRALLTKHVEAASSDVGPLEAAGALNFLDLDDIKVLDEGEVVDPRSVIALPIVDGRAVLPKFEAVPGDPFVRQLDASGKRWVVITDDAGVPRFALDVHRFLRDVLFQRTGGSLQSHLHRPIVIADPRARLGDVMGLMYVRPEHPEDDVIDNDLILVWGAQHRIITGADLLGRLLRGITRRRG